MTGIISLTQSAADKLKEFMIQEEKGEYLRVYVQGGGCSGLSYGMGFENNPQEDDILIEDKGVKIVIDTLSADHLKGTQIEWIEGLEGAGFKFINPNVKKSCSCGSSFST